MSTLTEAMIVNAIVLITVLATDLGPARKIGPGRLLRPVLAAAVIIPFFIKSPATHGTALVVELAGIGAGLLGGLIAAALMRVYRSELTGQPVSSAGWGYAAFWIVVVAARAAFSYGAGHWFTNSIVTWCVANNVSEAAITDALVFMAIAMILVRTAGLGARAARLTAGAPAQAKVSA